MTYSKTGARRAARSVRASPDRAVARRGSASPRGGGRDPRSRRSRARRFAHARAPHGRCRARSRSARRASMWRSLNRASLRRIAWARPPLPTIITLSRGVVARQSPRRARAGEGPRSRRSAAIDGQLAEVGASAGVSWTSKATDAAARPRPRRRSPGPRRRSGGASRDGRRRRGPRAWRPGSRPAGRPAPRSRAPAAGPRTRARPTEQQSASASSRLRRASRHQRGPFEDRASAAVESALESTRGRSSLEAGIGLEPVRRHGGRSRCRSSRRSSLAGQMIGRVHRAQALRAAAQTRLRAQLRHLLAELER